MSEYEQEWTTGTDLPRRSRLRIGYSSIRGTPTSFIVQLEYWHAGEWLQVARFEHRSDGKSYQNVERSGLHLDLHHPDGTQVSKLTYWQPQPSDEAMDTAEKYLRQNAETFLRRFETWL